MTTCDVNGSRNCSQNFLKKPKIGYLFVCFKWNEKRNFKIVPSIFTFSAMSSYASRTFDKILQQICKISRSFRLKTKEIANFERVKWFLKISALFGLPIGIQPKMRLSWLSVIYFLHRCFTWGFRSDLKSRESFLFQLIFFVNLFWCIKTLFVSFSIYFNPTINNQKWIE